jgi:hypothetical protein
MTNEIRINNTPIFEQLVREYHARGKRYESLIANGPVYLRPVTARPVETPHRAESEVSVYDRGLPLSYVFEETHGGQENLDEESAHTDCEDSDIPVSTPVCLSKSLNPSGGALVRRIAGQALREAYRAERIMMGDLKAEQTDETVNAAHNNSEDGHSPSPKFWKFIDEE